MIRAPVRPRVLSALTGPGLLLAARRRVAEWETVALSPRRAQERVLVAHCRRARNTTFGSAHRLGQVRSYEDFRARVPVRSYADYEPYIRRMRAGQRDVLWPGLVPYFGESSGTSGSSAASSPGGSKYLPISRDQIEWQKRAGFDLLARYLATRGDATFTRGYTLALWPPSLLREEGEVIVTNNPGLMSRHLPLFAGRCTLPAPPVRDIEDCETKLDRMAECYLDHDVRALSGTTCWFSMFFDRVLDAARARGRSVQTVLDVWPNLRVLFGGGVHAAPYRPAIEARLGGEVLLIDNYSATEGGILAATDRAGDDGQLMLPDRGVFFEFLRRDERGSHRVPLWEVEPSIDYSVVLTTASGLFAYEIGDVVRFVDVFPHRMIFRGRLGGALSLTQEHTSASELESAITRAARGSQSTVVEFAAACEVGVEGSSLGRYLFFVEFERAPADLTRFAEDVDQHLRAHNRVYRTHRAGDVAILAPRVRALPRGATRRFMELSGQRSVQEKFPRVVDDARRDLLASLA